MLDQTIAQQKPGDSLLTWGELAHVIRSTSEGIASCASLPIILPLENNKGVWEVVIDDLSNGFAKPCPLYFPSGSSSANSVVIPAQDGRRFITRYDVLVKHVPLLPALEAKCSNGYYVVPISRSEARDWLESQEV